MKSALHSLRSRMGGMQLPHSQAHLFIVFLLVVALALPSLPASAAVAPDVVTISGRVTRFAGDTVGGGAGESNVLVVIREFQNGGESVPIVGSATTDANGNYTIVIRSTGHLFISASKGTGLGAFNIVGDFSAIIPGPTAVTRNFISHRPTIVMVAGYTGLDTPKSNCRQSIPGRSYDPGVCPNDAFDSYRGASFAESFPQELRDEGYHVRIAVLESSILGTPSIANLVPIVTAAIDSARGITGAPKVIVIAHSTGGIVTRRYIESGGYRGDVSHFFTFGSPHRGAPLERIVAVLAPLIIASGGLLAGTSVAAFCASQTAVCDMSEAGMTAFNLQFRPRNGVSYHIIQGDSIRMRTCTGLFGIPYPCPHPNNAKLTPFGATFDLITNGDGLIGANSINLQGTHDRLLVFDAHHSMSGEPWYMQKTGERFGQGYTNCLQPVLINRSRTNCGTVSGPTVPVLSAQETADESPGTPEIIGTQSGELSAGQTATRTVSVVDQGYPAVFGALWPNGGAQFQLRAPDGTIINPDYATHHSDVVTYTETSTEAIYEFAQANSGTYTMEITALSAPQGTLSYSTVAGFQSEYGLTASRNRNWYVPGTMARLSASLNGESITEAQVMAHITRADGVVDSIALVPQGDGQYAVDYVVPNAFGYADVQVIATGKAAGKPFERARTFNFQICPDGLKLSGAYNEVQASDALTVTVGLNVTGDHVVRLTGILVAADTGEEVAVATTIQTVQTGQEQMLALRFEADDILAAKRDGPYRLARVLVVDESSAALVNDDQSNVYTTAAYLLNQFGPRQVFIPVVLK